MFIEPGCFHGKPPESPSEFIRDFRRAAIANNWTDNRAYTLLPSFLKGAAALWFDSLGPRCGGLDKLDSLTNALEGAFRRLGEVDDLEDRLRYRVQGVDESLEEYAYEVLSLCQRVDSEMTEATKVKYLMRGLKPSLVERVTVLPNENVEQLLQNLRNIERGLTYARARQVAYPLPQ